MDKRLKVLSLFDGMSCGQIAISKLGIPYSYYASEIKPHAIKVTQENFPNTNQIGDVREVSYKNGILHTKNGKFNVGKIDIIIGGSPCKGISTLNQKQQGLKHKESILFFEYSRIYKEVQSRYFLLENTHGNKESTNTISKEMGVQPISINSKIVSAQNRPRYYWTNIKDIIIPEDRGITTEQVFEYDGDIVPYNRLEWLNSESGKNSVRRGYTRINPYPKSGCITANGYKKWNENYLMKDGIVRHLSKKELERLQTIPEGYVDILTYDEAYDVIGDGWTVDIIVELLRPLVNEYN